MHCHCGRRQRQGIGHNETTTHTTANPEGVDVAEDGKPEAKKQTLEVVSTTSRQRFGDTRDMSMFPLWSPLLEEFKQQDSSCIVSL